MIFYLYHYINDKQMKYISQFHILNNNNHFYQIHKNHHKIHHFYQIYIHFSILYLHIYDYHQDLK